MPSPYAAFEALLNTPQGIDRDYYNSLPEYLRNNLIFQPGGSEGAPDTYAVSNDFRNSRGQQVVRTNPDGTVNMNGARLRDPSLLMDDPDLGTTTPAENLDQSEWEARHSRNARMAALAILAAATAGGMGWLPGTGLGEAGGLSSLGGAGANPFAGAVAGGELSAGLGASPFAGAVAGAEGSFMPSLSQALRGANSIRQLLGGGQEGSPSGGMAMMMGAAPQIGQHRPNTDLYGLQASGLGAWSPFTKEDPKKKAIEALLAQQQLPNWG